MVVESKHNQYYFNHKDLLSIGYIKSFFGINGGVRVSLNTSFPEILKNGCPLFIKYNPSFNNLNALYKISSIASKDFEDRQKDLFLMLIVKDFNHINETMYFSNIFLKETAQELKSAELFCTKEYTKEHCRLNKDEFFYFDIIGLELIEDGESLGFVKDIQNIANTDYFMLESGALVPYIDRYIKDICLDSRCIKTIDVKYLINL